MNHRGRPLASFEEESLASWTLLDYQLVNNGFCLEHLDARLPSITNQREISLAARDLLRPAPWFSFFSNVCFVGRYPSALIFDESRRILSANSGPALAFQDALKYFFVEGVRIPRKYAENPERISVEDIEDMDNIAVRRYMINSYGEERYIQDSKAELVHRDEFGELYRKELAGDEPLTMVRVVNSTPEIDGTYRSYFLRVPPTVATAREAVAWTFDLPEGQEYNPEVET